MDALIMLAQVIALCALAVGCYLCISNWHLGCEDGMEDGFPPDTGRVLGHTSKEQHMKRPSESRNAGAWTAAILLAVAASIIVLTFSPLPDPPGSTTALVVPPVRVEGSPSGLFGQAMAALPGPSQATPVPQIAGGDSRVDDYRLERDSCCIGN
ncbi:MAG: hypothetical protein ACXWUK_01620 [Burkholderiales bacterium]